MKKTMKNVFSWGLMLVMALCLISPGTVQAAETANVAQLSESYEQALTKALANRKQECEVPTAGYEWAVLSQTRNGNTDDKWYHSYYHSVLQEVQSEESTLFKSATDYARVTIALTSMGISAADVGGKNLIEPLADFSYAKGLYVTSPIYVLIALDCGNYEIPDTNAEDKTTRDKLITNILENFNTDGCVESYGYVDMDSTAMGLQALAPYYSTNADVKEMVDKSLAYLSKNQNEDGSFGMWDVVCTTAQVICGLSALDIDVETDARFIKNGISPLDAMLAYAKEDGSIAMEDAYSVSLSTEQAGYALVSYDRLKKKQSSLYDMAEDKLSADSFYKCAKAESVTKNKKEATCTQEGYTGDTVCENCGYVVVQGNTIEKKAHTVVTDPAVAATEDKEGKTEGSHCSVCNKVIKEQTTIPKLEKKQQVTTQEQTSEPVSLEKPVVKKVKSGKKKQIKVTLSSKDSISGYQIQVSTSSKFKKAKTYTVKKATTVKTIKGLTSKKKYYVRTRTYKRFVEDNQKVTIYSKWSKVKSTTVK